MLRLQSSSDLRPIRGSEYEIILCFAAIVSNRAAVSAETFQASASTIAIAKIALNLDSIDRLIIIGYVHFDAIVSVLSFKLVTK